MFRDAATNGDSVNLEEYATSVTMSHQRGKETSVSHQTGEVCTCPENPRPSYTDIFNISLSSAAVPTCLKSTTIVPVPKKSTVLCLNDYRPITLKPIMMKCFERLVMRHIKTQIPPSLDPLQFVYCPNCSTDDAVTPTLHLALTHLDNKDSYTLGEHRVAILFIDESSVEIVKSTKFLGVHLAENFTWSLNTSSISKKAQQCLYFQRRLRKAHLPILTMFYRGTIESILSSCITAWFGNCIVSDHKTLEWIVRTAEKIIGVSLSSITDIYTTCCICKANSIVDNPAHPSHTHTPLTHTLHSPAIWKE
ncbi:hypothetical protein QTP70_024380, partial [Hemibagrus guttatus]